MPETLVRSTSFEIEIGDLKCKSKKPHHLEARLRKSAPMAKSGHMEKLSAGQARKLALLDARKKACGYVIRKAKTVAERQAKKALEEKAVKKAALEAKLLETENRRQRLLLVPRSKLMSDDVLSEISELDKRQKAARKIQVWWRGIKVSICTRLFLKVGLSMKLAKVMPFPVLAKKGQTEQVMKAVGRMLVRAKRMSSHPVENWQAPSRIFLSSYLVLAYPEQVMPIIGEKEEVRFFSLNREHDSETFNSRLCKRQL
jgi:hypothetical protein